MDIDPRRVSIGFSLAAVAAVLFSAKAILAKLQYLYGLDALDVMALRMLFAAPLFILLAISETLRARRQARRLSGRDHGLLILLGLLGYYVSSLLDFWGLEYVPASLERLLLFLNPTFVLLIGLFCFGRAVRPRQWWAMAISYLGVALVLTESLRLEGEHILFGSVLVLGAATTYALYLAVSGELIQRIGTLRLVAYAMCVSTAATLIHYGLARPYSALLGREDAVYALAAANALFCTFAPVTLTMAAVARIGSGATAQLSVLGPVSLLFLGHWLLDERISLLQILGTAVVLAGIWVLTRPAANSLPLAAASITEPGAAPKPGVESGR